MDTQEFTKQWQQVAVEVRSGMSRWRQAHPTATLTEIERETDRWMAVLRACWRKWRRPFSPRLRYHAPHPPK